MDLADLRAATANLDTALLAMGWSLRRRRFTLGAVVVIGVVTTAATWLALTLGHWAAGCLTVLTAKKAGGALLIAHGRVDDDRRPAGGGARGEADAR